MFDPKTHLTQLPQGKDRDGKERYAEYLEVKWRLCWFREQCPEGTIDTEEITVDLDREVSADAIRWVDDPQRQGKKKKETYTKTAKGYARYKAVVTDGKGGRATAHKSESAVNFEDFIEKAETGAVGRALAMLGYGTQFTGDELAEDHRIVDAPVESKNGHQNGQTSSHPSTNGKAVSRPSQPEEMDVASPAPDDAPTPGQLRASFKRLVDERKLKGTFEAFISYKLGVGYTDEELSPKLCALVAEHLAKYDGAGGGR